MKEYPSIPGPAGSPPLPCIAFKKYDGSNLRFLWDRRAGWCQFGTRRRLFTERDPEYGPAVHLFLRKYADGVERVIRGDQYFRRAEKVICYCEFFGPHSFAGQHDPAHPVLAMTGVTSNDPKDLVLLDVNVHRKGLLAPRHFLDAFGQLPVAEVVYEGPLSAEFIEDVRRGKYPVWEGIVCKGLVGKAPHGIWMRKVKTFCYLEELKRRFGADWEQYGE
jgi:hypothetical protein